MIGMDIKLDPDEPVWPNDPNHVTLWADELSVIEVAVLRGGMESGHPSVALRIKVEDPGTQPIHYVVAQTSARLFVTAAKAIEARYPHLLD